MGRHYNDKWFQQETSSRVGLFAWEDDWPLPKQVRNWVRIRIAKSFGTHLEAQGKSQYKVKMPHHSNCGCLCNQVHNNCSAAAFLLVLTRIRSLEATWNTTVVLIQIQFPTHFGNAQYVKNYHYQQQKQTNEGSSESLGSGPKWWWAVDIHMEWIVYFIELAVFRG